MSFIAAFLFKSMLGFMLIFRIPFELDSQNVEFSSQTRLHPHYLIDQRLFYCPLQIPCVLHINKQTKIEKWEYQNTIWESCSFNVKNIFWRLFFAWASTKTENIEWIHLNQIMFKVSHVKISEPGQKPLHLDFGRAPWYLCDFIMPPRVSVLIGKIEEKNHHP